LRIRPTIIHSLRKHEAKRFSLEASSLPRLALLTYVQV
jgi:hypothetical protein